MREASWASAAELETLLDALLASAKLVMPIHFRQRPLLSDASDEMVFECALHGGASAIVTLNQRDFQPAAKRFGLEVLKPGELLTKLRTGEGP
jgi:predicted nucleic acid-binding protein